MIFTIRGLPVMIDRDLADVYGVENKRLNEQVKRNIERFPDTFRFQLTDAERDELVANCDRFASLKHATTNPYAFTEHGVSMLSAVLRSETATAFMQWVSRSRPASGLSHWSFFEGPWEKVVRLLQVRNRSDRHAQTAWRYAMSRINYSVTCCRVYSKGLGL